MIATAILTTATYVPRTDDCFRHNRAATLAPPLLRRVTAHAVLICHFVHYLPISSPGLSRRGPACMLPHATAGRARRMSRGSRGPALRHGIGLPRLPASSRAYFARLLISLTSADFATSPPRRPPLMSYRRHQAQRRAGDISPSSVPLSYRAKCSRHRRQPGFTDDAAIELRGRATTACRDFI